MKWIDNTKNEYGAPYMYNAWWLDGKCFVKIYFKIRLIISLTLLFEIIERKWQKAEQCLKTRKICQKNVYYVK